MTLPGDDDGRIRVNFSEKEATSESREVTPVPRGKYQATVTDCEMRECGPTSKNPGKPYLNFEFTITEGPYANRKVWTNAMLFTGALYTITQMLKALGEEVNAGEMVIEPPEWWIDKEFVIVVTIKKAVVDELGNEKYSEGNEVRGFFPSGTDTSPASTATPAQPGRRRSGNLLPG
jgi:hypothetical protein